jgi:hypothetical protein
MEITEVIADKKMRIVEKINESKDLFILHEMERLIDEVNEEGSIYHLTEKQEAILLKSREQYKRGETSSHDEVFDRIGKWLKK